MSHNLYCSNEISITWFSTQQHEKEAQVIAKVEEQIKDQKIH